jgi:hypothetical protein
MIYVKQYCFEVKWSYGEVLGDKSTMHIRVIFIILTVQFLFIIHLYTNKIALKFTSLKTTH